MSAAYRRLVDALDARGFRGRANGRQADYQCPAHDDRNPSLSVTATDDRVLVKCHGGCETQDVLAALGLSLSDLYDEPRANGARREVEFYSYTDEQGAPLFEVVRFEPKDFRQRTPDGAWSIKGVRRVLYRLPAVLAAIERGEKIWVAEGETDVHALERAGVVATCNPAGAGKWRDEYAETLRGADVVVVQDCDKPGREHAAEVARSLEGVAASVGVVEAAVGKDAADHLAAGKTLAEFVEVRPRDELDGLLVDMREAMLHADDPVPYLIEPIAVRGLVTVLVGRHSSMKSWLMILGAAAAHGFDEHVAGYRITQCPALYIDAEMGSRLMARRFARAGLSDGAFHVADGFRLRLPQSKAKIADLIRRTGARLVVMDSLRRLAPGSRENDSDDMSPIMACLAELSRELDVAIVLIHHRSTKEGAAETRGSSAIEDQADIVLAFEHVKDDPDENRRRLRTVKFRPDEEPAPTWVRLGGGFRFAIEAAEPYGPEAGARPRDEHRNRVLAALSDEPRSGRSIAAELDMSEATTRRLLHDLESDEEVRQAGRGWVRHHPVPTGDQAADAPPENGSTMRDLGASPPVTHTVPDAPQNGDAAWTPHSPDEDAPDWWVRP